MKEVKNFAMIMAQKRGKGNRPSLFPLAGDASQRDYFRAVNEKDSFVVSRDRSFHKESFQQFLEFQRLWKKAGVRVPEIYGYEEECSCIAIEDLGDETLLGHLARTDKTEYEYDTYRRAVDELIKIHSLGEGSWDKKSLDKVRLTGDISHARKYFLEKTLHVKKEPALEVERLFDPLCCFLDEQEKVVTHRDFHSKNIMINKGECVIIDFQDAMLGLPQYDLASLLEDPYRRVSPKIKESLKEYYWQTVLPSGKVQGQFKDFSYAYDLALVQRLFKAIGSFSSFFVLRDDYSYLRYIGQAFESMRETLLKYNEYKELRHALVDAYYYGQ